MALRPDTAALATGAARLGAAAQPPAATGAALGQDPSDNAGGARLGALLEWAYQLCLKVHFLPLVVALIAIAVGLAMALAVPLWHGLYGVRPGAAALVTFIVAVLTATPLTVFIIHVLKKAEATRVALLRSNEALRAERERQAATLRELRIARDEAFAANTAKSRFLANMSHELRTPLNAIIGFSEMITAEALGPLGNPRYGTYVHDISTSGRLLLGLINDILDVARIDAGRMTLNEEIVDVADIVAAASRACTPRAEAEGITIRTAIRPDLPSVSADPQALRKMLACLLSNAIGFSLSGGVVQVTATLDGAADLVITVSDTGIGMSEQDIPTAMAPFSQVDNSDTRRHQGAGLGLTLVQSLMRLHGGALTLTSEQGVGTHASLHFPRTRVVTATRDSA